MMISSLTGENTVFLLCCQWYIDSEITFLEGLLMRFCTFTEGLLRCCRTFTEGLLWRICTFAQGLLGWFAEVVVRVYIYAAVTLDL